MKKSAPILAPEWLKAMGGSDEVSTEASSTNRSSPSNINPGNLLFSNLMDRKTRSCMRSMNDNGFADHKRGRSVGLRPYSSSVKNYLDGDSDIALGHRDKERLILVGNEKDGHLNSLWKIRGPGSESNPKRLNIDVNDNALPSRILSKRSTSLFEREFPSLGAKEKQGATDMWWSSCSIADLLTSSNTDSLMNALAEMPMMSEGNQHFLSTVKQYAPTSSASTSPSINAWMRHWLIPLCKLVSVLI